MDNNNDNSNKVITVLITPNKSGHIRYIPSHRVMRGGKVNFVAAGISRTVEVSFDKDSCFDSQGPYVLTEKGLLLSSYENQVSRDACNELYPFTVSIDENSELMQGGEKETKKGTIEVTTDGPGDPERKK